MSVIHAEHKKQRAPEAHNLVGAARDQQAQRLEDVEALQEICMRVWRRREQLLRLSGRSGHERGALRVERREITYSGVPHFDRLHGTHGQRHPRAERRRTVLYPRTQK